jgi:hypothetical protein
MSARTLNDVARREAKKRKTAKKRSAEIVLDAYEKHKLAVVQAMEDKKSGREVAFRLYHIVTEDQVTGDLDDSDDTKEW